MTPQNPTPHVADARPDGPLLALIDAPGYIFRAYHALPKFSTSTGLPVGAVRGFVSLLRKFLRDANPDYVACCFDTSHPTFRDAMYPQYKAHREAPPEDLRPQFALVRDVVEAFDLPMLERPGYEADDIMATLAEAASAKGIRVALVSSDKDLMQLVRPGVVVFDPGKERWLGTDGVREKFGVDPALVIDVQGLAGDSVDGIPGVPGVGIKTAADLVNTYGSLDGVLASIDKISGAKRKENLAANADIARLSKELARLKRDVPDLPTIDALARRPEPADRLVALFTRLEFRALIKEFQTASPNVSPAASTATSNGGSTEPDDDPTQRNDQPATRAAAHAATQPTEPGAHPSESPVLDASLAPIDRSMYEMITSENQLDDFLARAAHAPFVALDTETDNLDAHRARVVGVSLAYAPNRACYIPLLHRGLFGVAQQLAAPLVFARLLAFFSGPNAAKFVGQNIKYDLIALARNGLALPTPVGDSMLASYVLDPTRMSHGMDALSRAVLAHEPIAFKSLVGKGLAATFDEVPLDKARDYAAEDADVTWRLVDTFHRALAARPTLQTLYETLELPLVSVLQAMEMRGIRIDTDLLARMSTDLSLRQRQFEAELHAIAGHTFNINSPKQLERILFDDMGLPAARKTKTGRSTDAAVLEDLASNSSLSESQRKFTQLILDWRALNKLQSTYVDALPQKVNPVTGRVHTNYSQAVAETGRLSSTDPNLQNIPVQTDDGRRIRNAFVAAPGNVLVAADYSQIELRIMAHMAGDEAMIRAFRAGADIHRETAAEMFGVAPENVSSDLRRRAKTINFGVVYGQTAFGLSQSLGISRSDADAYIRQYFERFSGVKRFIDDAIQRARDTGVATTLFGRERRVHEINSENRQVRQAAERIAVNTPIQGTAADLIKAAMLRLEARLARELPNVQMLLQVHDELVFECPPDDVSALSAIAREEMAAPLALNVPLVVDVGHGANWAEAH